MNADPPTAAYAPPADGADSPLRYEPPSVAAGWPPEATAIVLGAAAASVLALALWAVVLLRYLVPPSFQSGLTFWPSLPIGIALLVMGGLCHAAVLAGTAAMVARVSVARPLLLAGGAGVLGLSVFALLASSFVPSGSTGAIELAYLATTAGVRLASMGLPHALLFFAVTRPSARWMSLRGKNFPGRLSAEAGLLTPDRGLVGGDWPLEAKVIVLAVALDAFCHLVRSALELWLAASHGSFRFVGVPPGVRYRIVLVASVAAYGTVLAGAAAALLRRHGRSTRWLAAGAAGCLAVGLYGLVATWWFPYYDYQGLAGAELITNATHDVYQTGTMAVVYALALYVVSRRYARPQPEAP